MQAKHHCRENQVYKTLLDIDSFVVPDLASLVTNIIVFWNSFYLTS